jgi:hypothetical protein
MIDSVPNFLVLARHALLISGLPDGSQKREISVNLPTIGVQPEPFDILLDLREQKRKTSDVEPLELFARYLKQIEALVAHVDRLEK